MAQLHSAVRFGRWLAARGAGEAAAALLADVCRRITERLEAGDLEAARFGYTTTGPQAIPRPFDTLMADP